MDDNDLVVTDCAEKFLDLFQNADDDLSKIPALLHL